MLFPYNDMFIKKYKAQTLVEVTMSIGIAVIVIVALVVLATSALRNAQESLRKSESSKFANAGIEAVIFYKNVKGFSGVAGGNYQIDNAGGTSVLTPVSTPIDGFVTIASPSGLVYQRKIEVTKAGTTMDVTSTVRWESTQGTKQSQVNRKITDWR